MSQRALFSTIAAVALAVALGAWIFLDGATLAPTLFKSSGKSKVEVPSNGASTSAEGAKPITDGPRLRAAAGAVQSNVTPQSFLMDAQRPIEAVAEARAKFGATKKLMYAESLLRQVCSFDSDPQDAIGTDDRSRAWAVRSLRSKCEGHENLQAISASAQPPYLSPVTVAKNSGVEAGERASLDVIRSSDEFPELFDAGQFLIDTGQLNFIPGVDPNLGTTELYEAWTHAAQLWSCDQNGGCGPQSLPTIAFCASAGCREGAALREALQAALPSRVAQAMDALYAWIGKNRRG